MATVSQPPFWSAACKHLMKRDRAMKRLIQEYPGEYLISHGDAFVTLVRSVIGQQISTKAAQAIWKKFSALAMPVTPNSFLKLKIEDMKAVGLSSRKVEYLVDLALHFANGVVKPTLWPSMDDEAIIKELVAIRGVGRWTAEMFLIFHLMRPNVLPIDDMGLLKGISQYYFSGEPVSRSEVKEMALAWEPYRTVATWYVWRALHPLPIVY